MLKDVLSKANVILRDAHRRLSVDPADAIEQVYVDIESLNAFIMKDIDRIEHDPDLSPWAKSKAKREVYEKAGRRLEVLKDRCNYASRVVDLKAGAATSRSQQVDMPAAGTDFGAVLKFMREREIRDRLFGMTEAQILSHFGVSLFDGSNTLLLDAILNAPPGFEMLSEPNIKKLHRTRVEKMAARPVGDPEAIQTVDAAVMEIFGLAKKKLDHLRKEELTQTFS